MTEEELLHRIKNALIVISDGGSFDVGGLKLYTNDDGSFSIEGNSLFRDFDRMTKSIAVKELNEMKYFFRRMTEISEQLSEFIANRPLEYALVFNYGMGELGICREKKGMLEWGAMFEG